MLIKKPRRKYYFHLVQFLVKDFDLNAIGLGILGFADLSTYSIEARSGMIGLSRFLVGLTTFVIIVFVTFIIVKTTKSRVKNETPPFSIF